MNRILCFLFFTSIVSVLFPSSAHAYDNPYYAQDAMRSGSEMVRFTAAAQFVHDRLYPKRSDFFGYICSVSKLLPSNRGSAFIELAALRIAEITGEETAAILTVLRSNPCRKNEPSQKKAEPKKHLKLDAIGSVVSSNPIWNACIRSLPMTGVFVRSNTDTFIHRQRNTIVKFPLSCRDYHRGRLNVWMYPEDPSVHLVLDRRGRLLGDAPIGYLLIDE